MLQLVTYFKLMVWKIYNQELVTPRLWHPDFSLTGLSKNSNIQLDDLLRQSSYHQNVYATEVYCNLQDIFWKKVSL